MPQNQSRRPYRHLPPNDNERAIQAMAGPVAIFIRRP